MAAFEYHHVVLFEETNLLRNVYFANHLRWQGHCRELFIREHAPGILAEFDDGIALVTTECSCEYLDELYAFDHVVVRMRIAQLGQTSVTMAFEYLRCTDGGEELVARGRQRVVCLLRQGPFATPAPVPAALREALVRYAGTAEVGA
jgi:enediyne biosynthesis thioesterase